MSIGLVLVMAASLATSDAPAASQTAAPPAAPTASSEASPQKVQSKDDRMVCRTILPTGSRLGGTRICRTQAEWTAMSRDAADAVSHAQMNGATGRIPGG